ncbi:MAG TPA: lasso peptide biosynthesis B2 protein [Tepidisphaeraceae bacterium]|nr:lasso peptide biosynthesis B2 protein [Tepidisphaeraceae bacterium]
MRRLHKFFSLPPQDQRLFIEAFSWLMAVRVGMWMMPFPVLRRCVVRLAHPQPRQRSSVDRLAGSIDIASRYVPHATCLAKAMAGQILLTRHGHMPTLQIGVKRDAAGKFQAHAWLEHHGAIIGGLNDLHTYAKLPPV